MKQVIVRISTKTGEVKVEAEGFKGSSCAEATAFLKSLGAASDFQAKSEFYEQEVAHEVISNHE